MTKEIKETIQHYLLLKSVSAFGILFHSAIYVTFLLSKGLNLFEVSCVNFIFFAMLFVCEIPTGAFADVFGRKLSFVLSCICYATGLFIYGLAEGFWGFALAEILSAIGMAFSSGAFQSWLIDRLKHQGYEGSFGKIFAVEQQLKNAMGIIAALMGAFVAGKSMSLVWFLSGSIMAIAGLLAIVFMKEEGEFIHQKFSFMTGTISMINTVRISAKYAASNKAVRFILIASLIQFFAVQAPNMQWQPFFGQFLQSKTSYGFIYGGISIAMIVGSGLAHRFLKIVKNEKKSLSIAQAMIGGGICLTVLFHSLLPTLGIFLAHELARGLFIPLKDVYLNDNIPSKERATLISFDSISHHIGGMIGLLVSGALAQYVSLPTAWLVSGIVLVISTMLLLKNGRK